MIVAFDAGMLSILIHPNATIPNDPETGKPLEGAKERIEHLVHGIEEGNGTIVIPTPALSEFLVVVDESGASYLRFLGTHACFDIQPFDERAAIECAESQRQAFSAGDKKSGAEGPYQKSKVDRQVVSVAKCWQVDRLYTTDKDVVNIANFCKVPVTAVWQLPLPPSEEAEDDPQAEGVPEAQDTTRLPFENGADAASEREAASQPTESAQPAAQSRADESPKADQPERVPPSAPQADPEPPPQGSSPNVAPPPPSKQ